MGIWSFAELSVAVIAGSIPPCRALAVQTLCKMRGEVVPNKNTPVVPKARSRHGYLLKRFSNIPDALSRIRGIPEASTDSNGSRGTLKRYQPTTSWERETNRAASQESGRDSILPLYSMQSPSSEEGIPRTFDVNVDTRGADDSLGVNELGQQ